MSKMYTINHNNSALNDYYKLVQVDFISTDEAARTLQANVDTIQLQLQEALDVCAQQENLLEEKVNEVQDLDDNIKYVQVLYMYMYVLIIHVHVCINCTCTCMY